MNNLSIIENGLIPIYQSEKGTRLVNARELHEFLEVSSKFADWVKNRIEKYEFVENQWIKCKGDSDLEEEFSRSIYNYIENKIDVVEV